SQRASDCRIALSHATPAAPSRQGQPAWTASNMRASKSYKDSGPLRVFRSPLMSAEAARAQSALRVPAAFRWLLGAIALLIGCGLAWAQSAQRFERRSAYVEPAEGV